MSGLGIPDYALTSYQTVGSVRSVTLEREGTYDALKFHLLVNYVDSSGAFRQVEPKFFRKVNANSVVATAQMHMLRDAMKSGKQTAPVVAHVHFLRDRAVDEWLEVTWVRIVIGYDLSVTLNEFFNVSPRDRFYIRVEIPM